MNSRFNCFSQKAKIKLIARFCLFEHLDKIDGAQVAALVREKRLLTARVCAFNFSYCRCYIIPVQSVQENYARFSVFPCVIHYEVKDLFCAEMTYRLFGLRIDEVVVTVIFHCLHKCFGNAHADIEICYLLVIRLAIYKLQNVRMIDSEDSHIGPAPGTALLYSFCGRIENLHKAYRSAGNAARASYGRSLLA